MAEIVSISRALPPFCHAQETILGFMQESFGLDETEKRKLRFLYRQSGINQRHSVIRDYGVDAGAWEFIPRDKKTAFPSIEERMAIFDREALPLSVKAIEQCIDGFITKDKITHLITVSCTGMSAPGLDLTIMEAMGLSPDIFRTSVNFMGCYAAIHGLKLAKMICDSNPEANVVMVATELCTLHFQKEFNADNASSSLLFADGSSAVLVSNALKSDRSLSLDHFYSEVAFRGKNDMSWSLNSQGFLMTLSSYVPHLIEEDIAGLVENALKNKLTKEKVTHWCLHPGGRKIIDTIQNRLGLTDEDVAYSRKVLAEYGNMSSPTILFVLKEIMDDISDQAANVLGIAFGPGLTMETFIATRK